MGARALLPLLPLAAALLLPSRTPVEARPEFAQREGKACGFCHINPRGGGPRNDTGVTYARNGFKFLQEAAEVKDLERESDRDAMRRVRRMLDVQHVPAAIAELKRLRKTIKGDAGKQLAADELHRLDVKGTERLGRGRLLLRSSAPDGIAEGVELIVLVSVEFKGLSVQEEAAKDLKELLKEPALKDLVRREETEARARQLLLDAALQAAEGEAERSVELYRQVTERYPESRAAAEARERLAARAGG
ncbi:MAG: hypothetical protein ACT4PV_15355 [Planctomycetaceae bacterium]